VTLPALIAAVAGGLLALAAREALVASPAAAHWVRLALEPLRRAGEEGYMPSTVERRRLAALGVAAAVVGGWFLAFAAALLSQRLAGGDLAGLLRRFAAGAAERERVAEDARSATAQARFTGLLVVAMPTGGALFAELLQPGFLAKLLSSPASAVLLVVAAALQVAGFLAIKRFAQVVE
jgi:hypothetical protein